jgi:hypothetical protein
LREAYAKGEVTCGMPAWGAFFFLFAGTVSQLLISLIVQAVLIQRRRRACNSDARFHSRLSTQ